MAREQVIHGNQISLSLPRVNPEARFALPGVDANDNAGVWTIDETLLSKHMMLLGAIGTGKSNATYHLAERIRNTMSSEDIMFIFDTKGDYYRQFYRRGDIVISNDERATNGYAPDYWNLFREITIDERQSENAMEIVNAIFGEKLEKTTQPFFPNAAKDLLRALILHIIRDHTTYQKGGDNGMLLKAMQNITPEIFVEVLKKYPDLRSMIPYIKDANSGQTLGVFSELQQGAGEVLIGNFARTGNLSMREMVRKKGGRVVFVEYDLAIGSVLTPIYRLLFDLAIKEALSRRKKEGNVYFIIDEFRLLPKLTHIDDGVNFGRSLGAKFIIGIQNVEQVYHAYGEALGRSLLSGFSTAIAFRLNDHKSREYIKQLEGQNGRVTAYESINKSKGIIEQYRGATVIEDNDIMNLRIGEALVCTNGQLPFRFRFREYGK